MILISTQIVPKGFLGLTIYPFIFLKNKRLKTQRVLVNHERIHLKQQLEMMIVPFFLFYILEFCFRLLKYKNCRQAYKNISFEREAYRNEANMDYLKSRPFWSFLSYLKC